MAQPSKTRPIFKVIGYEFAKEQEINQYMVKYNLSRAEAEQAIALEDYVARIADSAGDCY